MMKKKWITGKFRWLKNIVLTIAEVAEKIGVVPKTIIRWEKAGKVKKGKRDWRSQYIF